MTVPWLGIVGKFAKKETVVDIAFTFAIPPVAFTNLLIQYTPVESTAIERGVFPFVLLMTEKPTTLPEESNLTIQ
jgi:hypothetical protein